MELLQNHAGDTMEILRRDFCVNKVLLLSCYIARVLFEINDILYFKVVDVCEYLEYRNASKAACDLIKSKYKITWEQLKAKFPNIKGDEMPNWKSNTILVSEAGLYSLIFKSKLKKAELLQDWVFEQVLPSIRRNKFYIKEDETNCMIDELRNALYSANAQLKIAKLQTEKNNDDKIRIVKLYHLLSESKKQLHQTQQQLIAAHNRSAHLQIEYSKALAVIKNNAALELHKIYRRMSQRPIEQDAYQEPDSQMEAEATRKEAVLNLTQNTREACDKVVNLHNNSVHILSLHQVFDKKGNEAVVFSRCQEKNLSRAVRNMNSTYSHVRRIYSNPHVPNSVNIFNCAKDVLKCRFRKFTSINNVIKFDRKVLNSTNSAEILQIVKECIAKVSN